MRRTVKTKTLINGNEVTVQTELEVSREEIEEILDRKEREFLNSVNTTNSQEECEDFAYEEFHSETNSEYTAYSSIASNSSNNNNEETNDSSSNYTPYVQARSASNIPRSYVAKINGDYSPYSTFRVAMPEGWKP
jgi:hypothetical protein